MGAVPKCGNPRYGHFPEGTLVFSNSHVLNRNRMRAAWNRLPLRLFWVLGVLEDAPQGNYSGVQDFVVLQ